MDTAKIADADDGYEFVELGRTFNAFSDYIGDSDELDVASVFHVASQLTWADLLKEYRVVILSEAGSGKTVEIRNAAKKIRAEGRAAFFLRLENVAANLEDAFEVGTHAEFEAWLTFFSVADTPGLPLAGNYAISSLSFSE